jgi:hypothetical protein
MPAAAYAKRFTPKRPPSTKRCGALPADAVAAAAADAVAAAAADAVATAAADAVAAAAAALTDSRGGPAARLEGPSV